MTYYRKIINYFGNQNKTAIACGIERNSIRYWRQNGIPGYRQVQIFGISDGKVIPEQWVIEKYNLKMEKK